MDPTGKLREEARVRTKVGQYDDEDDYSKILTPSELQELDDILYSKFAEQYDNTLPNMKKKKQLKEKVNKHIKAKLILNPGELADTLIDEVKSVMEGLSPNINTSLDISEKITALQFNNRIIGKINEIVEHC